MLLSKDLTKKAVELLLKGGTLLSEPCPYCKGVRVMKDGNALCVNCGKKPEKRNHKLAKTKSKNNKKQSTRDSSLNILEKKLESLSKKLESEKDFEKQQQILKSINSLVEIIEKLKN